MNLTKNERRVLAILAMFAAPVSGKDLATATRAFPRSSVYVALKTVYARGFADATWDTTGEWPNRLYRITGEGRAIAADVPRDDVILAAVEALRAGLRERPAPIPGGAASPEFI